MVTRYSFPIRIYVSLFVVSLCRFYCSVITEWTLLTPNSVLQYAFFFLFLFLFNGRVVVTEWIIDTELRTSVFVIILAATILGHMIICRSVINACVPRHLFDKFCKRRLFIIRDYNLFLFYTFFFIY